MSLKKCSKCSKDFDCCNEKSGCWCEAVKLDSSALKQLKQEFEDCLCKDCLYGFEITK